MEQAIALGASWPGAVGVSGGGDSLALLLLLADWARDAHRAAPIALVVDHGLRPDSAAEAASIAKRAKSWRIPAHVLTWHGKRPQADIEAAARDARYRLMGDWCAKNGFGCLYVAHTREDQAETFLLRLARGSGVDGLAAMSPVSDAPVARIGTLRVARPLLSVSRARLRAALTARGETWLDDPMNGDPRFARARLRAAWPALESLGLTTERVTAAARHLARARKALEAQAEAFLEENARDEEGCVLVNRQAFATADDEIALRALAQVLMRVSGAAYRPRFERLERLLAAIRGDLLAGGRTLHGCCIRPMGRPKPDMLRVAPEPKRKAPETRAGF